MTTNVDDQLGIDTALWDRLSQLLAKAKGRGDRLAADEILELGATYRGAVAELARLRAETLDSTELSDLEALCSNARWVVYGAPRERISARYFLAHTYWRLLAYRPRSLVAGILVFVIPVILVAWWVTLNPGAAASASPSTAERFSSVDGMLDPPMSFGDSFRFAFQLFTNNIGVTMFVFAGAALAGVGAIIIALNNALNLGLVIGFSSNAGLSADLWRFLIPHGPIELSCVMVAICVGLRMAIGIFIPGEQPRSRAFAEQARDGMLIVLGTMPWVVIAGILEAFVRPSGLGILPRTVIGLGVAATFWTLVVKRGTGGYPPPADLGI